ncbi:MAG TPA: hypothetical protein VG820_07410 [Fimbriimonadaceae bacterium]|nr:hypothetical protein [Fimbriimonadaceae bacterium]
MKKRKAPVLLLSLLVVLVGGAVVFGMSSSQGDAPKQTDTSDQITKEHDAPSASEVQTQLAKNTPAKEAVMKQPAKLLERENELKGPTITVPKRDEHYQKPTPTGPTTSSQWYYH